MMPNTPFPFSTDLPFKDEQVDPVTFVSAPEEPVVSSAAAAIKGAEKAATKAPVKVRVCNRYRVVWDGRAYIGGETLSVPADTAERWLKFKFVEKVSRGKN